MLKEFFKSKKRIAVVAVLAVLLIGLFSGGESAPVLELKEPTVCYGNELSFRNFVDVTNKEPEEVQLTITAEPSKDVSIDQENQRIEFQTVGAYELEITAEDTKQQVTSKTMEIVVADGTAPKIVLDGKFSIEATEDAPDYLEQLTAKDAIDGDLSDQIVVDDSAVEYGKVGSYKITATVEDHSGNICSKEFPVTIEDTEEPELTVTKTVFSLTEGDYAPSYADYIRAADDVDGDITDIVIDDGDVDYDTPGVYYVKVKATDKSGNTTTEELEVDVEADASSYTSYASNSYSDSSDDYDDYEGESYSGGGTVYVTRTGECYHTHACGNGNYYEATLAEAEARGLRPCQKCY